MEILSIFEQKQFDFVHQPATFVSIFGFRKYLGIWEIVHTSKITLQRLHLRVFTFKFIRSQHESSKQLAFTGNYRIKNFKKTIDKKLKCSGQVAK